MSFSGYRPAARRGRRCSHVSWRRITEWARVSQRIGRHPPRPGRAARKTQPSIKSTTLLQKSSLAQDRSSNNSPKSQIKAGIQITVTDASPCRGKETWNAAWKVNAADIRVFLTALSCLSCWFIANQYGPIQWYHSGLLCMTTCSNSKCENDYSLCIPWVWYCLVFFFFLGLIPIWEKKNPITIYQ